MSLFIRYGAPLAVIGVLALWLYHNGYRSCQADEAVKTLTTLVEIKHAQMDVYTTAPRTRADVIERLRNGTF